MFQDNRFVLSHQTPWHLVEFRRRPRGWSSRDWASQAETCLRETVPFTDLQGGEPDGSMFDLFASRTRPSMGSHLPKQPYDAAGLSPG